MQDKIEPEDWIRDIADERLPAEWRSLLQALESRDVRWEVRQRKDDGAWECIAYRGVQSTIFTVHWAYVTEAMVVEGIDKRLAQMAADAVVGTSYRLLRDVVWALEPYDARDGEDGRCMICHAGDFWKPAERDKHEPDCPYVAALAYVTECEKRGA